MIFKTKSPQTKNPKGYFFCAKALLHFLLFLSVPGAGAAASPNNTKKVTQNYLSDFSIIQNHQGPILQVASPANKERSIDFPVRL
jgi:hypothetical protein